VKLPRRGAGAASDPVAAPALGASLDAASAPWALSVAVNGATRADGGGSSCGDGSTGGCDGRSDDGGGGGRDGGCGGGCGGGGGSRGGDNTGSGGGGGSLPLPASSVPSLSVTAAAQP